jgi:MarR family transcriptional regulator, negative regulator of the multidrug operon emrRAB
VIGHLTSQHPRYRALIQLLRTADTLWNSSRGFFARWDLNPSQFNVLNLLHELPQGMSQTELSRALLMHRSNLTGLVDGLEERGLVKRLETPGDRRSYRVVLSAQGSKVLGEILPRYYAAACEVWGDVSEQRANEICKELNQVCLNTERLATRLNTHSSDKL